VLDRAATVLLASLLLAGCQGKDSAPKKAEAEDKETAPEYTGRTLKGDVLKLQDFRGKVVLVNIWATWCKPCRKELPELVALHDEYGGDDFTVLGISVDARRDLKKVNSAVSYFGLDYPMVFDPGGDAVTTFNIKGYPTSIILGRDGTVRWRRDGLIEPGDPEVAAQLEAALAAK
jgi:thiol-disulfide isomerase/thioredoxin